MKNFFLIAGPCIIEDSNICNTIAARVSEMCSELGITYIFKASYKKANRTSIDSFTGIDMLEALEILKNIHDKFKVPVITDVHETHDCEIAAAYVDYLQIPAFLCRQTDLLIAAPL